MGEAKPIASLSSTLLARKGHAKPAMRPQGFQNFGFGAPHAIDDLGWNDMGGEPQAAPSPAATPAVATPATPVARLAEVVPIAPDAAPVAPPVDLSPIDLNVVHRQREEIAREMALVVEPSQPDTTPVAAPAPTPAQSGERRRDDRARSAVTAEVDRVVVARAGRGSKAKAAFTLRLDGERHLRLRLAGAFAHRSSQAIVVEALDTYLGTLPRVIELARDIAGRTPGRTPGRTDDAPDAAPQEQTQAQVEDKR